MVCISGDSFFISIVSNSIMSVRGNDKENFTQRDAFREKRSSITRASRRYGVISDLSSSCWIIFRDRFQDSFNDLRHFASAAKARPTASSSRLDGSERSTLWPTFKAASSCRDM